jgi:hypothetical protein
MGVLCYLRRRRYRGAWLGGKSEGEVLFMLFEDCTDERGTGFLRDNRITQAEVEHGGDG